MNTTNTGGRILLTGVILIALFGKVQSQITTKITKPSAIACFDGKIDLQKSDSKPGNIAVPAPIATVDSLKIKQWQHRLAMLEQEKSMILDSACVAILDSNETSESCNAAWQLAQMLVKYRNKKVMNFLLNHMELQKCSENILRQRKPIFKAMIAVPPSEIYEALFEPSFAESYEIRKTFLKHTNLEELTAHLLIYTDPVDRLEEKASERSSSPKEKLFFGELLKLLPEKNTQNEK